MKAFQCRSLGFSVFYACLLILFSWSSRCYALAVGDRVQATSNLNIRSTASTSGALLATAASGSLGNIISGPTTANGLTWWRVDWDSYSTGWSAQDYLLKVTVAPAPSISSISPNPITADAANGYQTVTINGSNFVSKPTVAVTWTGGGTTVSSSQVTFVSSTRLTISIKLGNMADNWTVKATNPDGKASSAVGFQVITSNPAPSISSVTPSPVSGSSSRQTISILGSNFNPYCIITLTWT
ncbi:MAG: SH3 domain-containing protein, partial [Fimbriimonadaceae bacterium]